MAHALCRKPQKVKERHAMQLFDLQQAYGESMLELRVSAVVLPQSANQAKVVMCPVWQAAKEMVNAALY